MAFIPRELHKTSSIRRCYEILSEAEIGIRKHEDNERGRMFRNISKSVPVEGVITR